jgi:hypothetical protein
MAPKKNQKTILVALNLNTVSNFSLRQPHPADTGALSDFPCPEATMPHRATLVTPLNPLRHPTWKGICITWPGRPSEASGQAGDTRNVALMRQNALSPRLPAPKLPVL